MNIQASYIVIPVYKFLVLDMWCISVASYIAIQFIVCLVNCYVTDEGSVDQGHVRYPVDL